jgi:hypothetical protein
LTKGMPMRMPMNGSAAKIRKNMTNNPLSCVAFVADLLLPR